MTKTTPTIDMTGFVPLAGVGDNIQGYIKGAEEMVLRIKLDNPLGTSTSGKSLLLASTKGNLAIPTADCKVGINVYRPVREG